MAANWNITKEAAVLELRDLEIEIATARAARALRARGRDPHHTGTPRARCEPKVDVEAIAPSRVNSRRAGINSPHGYCSTPRPTAIDVVVWTIRGLGARIYDFPFGWKS